MANSVFHDHVEMLYDPRIQIGYTGASVKTTTDVTVIVPNKKRSDVRPKTTWHRNILDRYLTTMLPTHLKQIQLLQTIKDYQGR